MDQAMATQQIPVSPPWYLFLGKPSESGVWLTGNVVLVAPILLLVHYHPSAETTSCLSHVFTIPVLCGHFHPFTHPLCASGSQGPPRKSWESLPLPRLGYLLLHQNGMKISEEALTVLSHKSPGLSNNSLAPYFTTEEVNLAMLICRRNGAAKGEQLAQKLLCSAASAN